MRTLLLFALILTGCIKAEPPAPGVTPDDLASLESRIHEMLHSHLDASEPEPVSEPEPDPMFHVVPQKQKPAQRKHPLRDDGTAFNDEGWDDISDVTEPPSDVLTPLSESEVEELMRQGEEDEQNWVPDGDPGDLVVGGDDFTTETKQPKKSAKYFTGLRVTVRSAKQEAEWGPCIPCRRAKSAAYAMQKYGWKVGYGHSGHHIWIQDATNEPSTPILEVIVNGKVLERIDAFYAGTDAEGVEEMKRILWKLPGVKRAVQPVSMLEPVSIVAYRGAPARSAPRVRRNAWALSRRGPDWGWPGRPSISALKRHLMEYPHRHSARELAGLSPQQLRSLHSSEHTKHARRTGDWSPVFPGVRKPFYGRINL